ncbi:hypothetical protein [Streptomyces alanosinicus]|uniref:Uncharacterized protein n=1 Tax=Streptomyces alanosinicus TaxID=68171 RepID=A0A919D7H0_9ACTN|nr:hypothetical protein [Streptomyces alanosinicus]GHE14483.1 hypothetical protein GCM10010339_85340 [Streptomyces alanosinicus]
MLRRTRRVIFGLGLVLGTVLVAPSAQARTVSVAGLGDISCLVGSQTGHYQPGLAYTVRPTSFTGQGSVSGCVDLTGHGITGATFTTKGSGTASCLTGTVSSLTTYYWSNGRSSTVKNTGAIEVKPDGITVLVLTGTVESGQFNGSTVVQTKTLLSTDLTACLTPQGLTSAGGPVTVTLTR